MPTEKQPRTNVAINKGLHRRVKMAAVKRDMTVQEWLEIAIVRLLRSKI